MGLAFALAALGSLVGTPIDGALLGERFIWWKTFIFSGVDDCSLLNFNDNCDIYLDYDCH